MSEALYVWCWGAESARMHRLPHEGEALPNGRGCITGWSILAERADLVIVELLVRYEESVTSDEGR